MNSNLLPSLRIVLLGALSLLDPRVTHAGSTERWPQFRGPNGSGIAERGRPPIHFGPTSNVLWRVSLDPGQSSPCIWDERIFLTTFASNRLSTLCLDRATGRVLWSRPAPAEKIEPFHSTGSPAAATPATDGRRVVAYFGSSGLFCYDFAGQERWSLRLPVPVMLGDYGASGSPVIHRGLVFLARDQTQGSELIAVRLRDGKIAWRVDRSAYRSSFATPVIWRHGSRAEVVLAGSLQFAAYDVRTGAMLWQSRGAPVCPVSSPVVAGNRMFYAGSNPGQADNPWPTFESVVEEADKDGDGAIGFEEGDSGFRSFLAEFDSNHDRKINHAEWQRFLNYWKSGENTALMIRAGGAGDVSTTHVAWKQARGLPVVPTPLAYGDYVYLVKDGGMVTCLDAETGAPAYQQERLGALGNYYASPVAADGRIYAASLQGVVVVLKAGPEFEVLARNDLGESIAATPAIADGHLYVRTAQHLYAFRGAE
jgi:outer membrane protein assembly factor BamB